MSSTRSLAALAFASAALHGIALQLRYLLRSDLDSPVGVVPPSFVAFAGLGLAVSVAFLGARQLSGADQTPASSRFAAVGGGALVGATLGHVVGLYGWPVALLGVGPSFFARALDPLTAPMAVAVLGSAVVATLACLAGTVVPRAVAADGRRFPASLAALTLLAGIFAGFALVLPASSTLSPGWRILPWWMYGTLSAVAAPLSVVAVARSWSTDSTVAPVGVVVLVAAALVGHLLGGAAVVAVSLLAEPTLSFGFHVPPVGLLWVDLVLGALVVGLGALAGLSPSGGGDTSERSRTSESWSASE